MHIPPPPSPGRVLGLATHHSATFYYRLVQPLRVLPSVSWATYDTVTAEQLAAADTAVLSCLGGRPDDVRTVVRSLRERWGIRRILVDYDDAVFVEHPVKEVRPPEDSRGGWAVALALADGVICTGPALAAHLQPHTAAPIAVVPNLVHPGDWPEPVLQDGPPVVVLAGGPSHRFDWELALPALRWLRRQHPDVELRVLGCPHPGIRALATEYIGWTTDLAEYQQALQGGAIGLCPLPDTPFNRCKSPIKAYEYALSGMAVIGSPSQYGALLSDGRGLIVPDGDAFGWAACLHAYLVSPAKRQADAARLRAHVLQTRTAASGTHPAIYDPQGDHPHAHAR
jgi:glycosyltransferase involved in cell wall biosynthesis